ncbi:biotin--[acetyl-CoA-carboxylase] ligase [Erythrobacter sp. KY5]|uniref:biotin--[acetyl-CoA-carboxylase] ligase n=1 Tax=Erythrobacter sp. KY5 TaxID=2011159 RepID=UPI000DBF2A68|nr:biotin--[acetyl-CoA-carboxylase] ligase [Erythrobacter sp. KY5]AWW74853.1 biotin--[acetyl-CoA-carboxylase] ligase [Erythrobacter sp. KY5]
MIRFIEETGSTNADLAASLRSGDPPARDDWLVARRQTAGKGRQGREWFDGTGNFMGSTVVAIRDGDPPPASLSFVAALAVADAIHETSDGPIRAELKWPNDVLIARAKVSGILLEMVDRSVVVGIGVNLAMAPKLADRRTAALADFGQAPNLETFAEELARRFASYVTIWRGSGLAAVLRAFLDASIHRTGDPVQVHDTDGSRIEGAFAGLDPLDGALKLNLADGSERVIRAGDIT